MRPPITLAGYLRATAASRVVWKLDAFGSLDVGDHYLDPLDAQAALSANQRHATVGVRRNSRIAIECVLVVKNDRQAALARRAAALQADSDMQVR